MVSRKTLQMPHHFYVKSKEENRGYVHETADYDSSPILQEDEVNDYLKYWGLREKPFENTTVPEYFFESYDHVEALERLFYIVEEQNMYFGLLTGEIGCGKTITRSVFKNRLSPIQYEVVDMENSNLPFNFILMECIHKLSADSGNKNLPDDNIYYLVKEFKNILKEKIVKRKKSLVIVLDEAQQLSKESITELKNLTNITFEDHGYVTIILMGQPELRSMVKNIPPVDQRVSLRFHLNPLSQKDIDGYLKHRLKVAGHVDGDIFTNAAVQFLSQVTGGVPREINRICKLALVRAFSLKADCISREVIKSIAMDIWKQNGKING